MADNKKNMKSGKASIEKTEGDKISRYAKASYFREKDKKAMEFLKKHPLPSKFL